MVTLSIELSTACGSATITDGTGILGETQWKDERRKPQKLVPSLRAMMDAANVMPDAIDRFAVGLGPGGFAGLRTSLAVARALALPGDRPVVGISSGMLVAAQADSEHATVLVVGDARRERLWMGRFDVTTPCPTQQGDYALISVPQLVQYSGQDCLIVTPDWTRLAQTLTELDLGEKLLAEQVTPRADTLAKLLDEGAGSTENPSAPIYLQPPVFIEPRYPAHG